VMHMSCILLTLQCWFDGAVFIKCKSHVWCSRWCLRMPCNSLPVHCCSVAFQTAPDTHTQLYWMPSLVHSPVDMGLLTQRSWTTRQGNMPAQQEQPQQQHTCLSYEAYDGGSRKLNQKQPFCLAASKDNKHHMYSTVIVVVGFLS
jgi:hypothetical protein